MESSHHLEAGYQASSREYRTALEDRVNIIGNGEINRSKTSVVKYFVAFLLAGLLSLAVYSQSNVMRSAHTIDFDALQGFDLADAEVNITVSIASPDYDEIRAKNYLPWEHIAEPYRYQIASINTFSINGIEQSITGSHFVEWVFNNQSFFGESTNFMVNRTGVINCTVTVYNVAKKQKYSSYFPVAMKYIRREIRDLTDNDRINFFEALSTIYSVSDEEGKELYGDRYMSAAALSHMHLNGAGRTDCDHWHDGAGLITHHVAFTLQCEQSLQAVDPSVAMPYWEYPMDSYLYDNYNWVESPIFSDDWFSEASPSNDLHQLLTGRFGDVLMPNAEEYRNWSVTETGSLNPFMNAYGQMRSPWNNNPSWHFGRHNNTYGAFSKLGRPGCSTMSDCYSSSSLAEMNDCMNGITHGPVHILIGGAWGEGDLFSVHPEFSYLQGATKLLLFKMLWRMGWSRCPVTCDPEAARPSADSDFDLDLALATCNCSVPQIYRETYGDEYILTSSGVLNALGGSVTAAYHDDDALQQFYSDLLEGIQSPGIAGEMFSSAAAFDPTFWPLHGTIERLLGLKRISLEKGWLTTDDFDESWGYETTNYLYLVGICDWSNVTSQDDLTLPTCNMSTDAVCPGHYENDVLEFTNFLGTGDVYTNIEMYALVHPWNDDLPYTYDSFDYDYCMDYYTDDTFYFNSFENTENNADGDSSSEDEEEEVDVIADPTMSPTLVPTLSPTLPALTPTVVIPSTPTILTPTMLTPTIGSPTILTPTLDPDLPLSSTGPTIDPLIDPTDPSDIPDINGPPSMSSRSSGKKQSTKSSYNSNAKRSSTAHKSSAKESTDEYLLGKVSSAM